MDLIEFMEGEELINGIKQLVISVEKYMQEAGSFEQAEERIRHLEENDEEFHKYDIVRNLKAKIDDSLGSLIYDEIEGFSVSGIDYISDQETLVTRVTEKILKSQEFKELNESIKVSIQEAVEELIEHFDTEFSGVNRDQRSDESPQKDSYSFSDEDSTVSSYNQGEFVFMSHDHLKKVSDNLDKRNSLEVRLGALDQLLRMSLNEVLTSDDVLWSSLQRGLIDALSETSDDQISNMVLKFVSKGFLSTPGNARELYATLSAYLYEYFVSKKNPIPKIRNGLDSSKPDAAKILKAFRLLNDFQRHVPNYWIRYPDRFLEEVIQSTLKLLTLGASSATSSSGAGTGPPAFMTPLHFLALLDPKAEWFAKWTHGTYSRVPLLKAMELNKGLIEQAAKSILDFVASRRTNSGSDTSDSASSYRAPAGTVPRRTSYTGDELEYIYFIHSIHVIGRLLTYVQGRNLFPLKIKGRDELTVLALLRSIVQLISDPRRHGSMHRNLAEQYEPAVMVTEVVRKLCLSEQTCHACMCRDDIVSALLAPVVHWLDVGNAGHDSSQYQPSEATYLHVADILSVIASCSSGRKHLLYGERGDRLTRTKSSAAHFIAEFTKRAISGSLPEDLSEPPSLAVTGAFLFVCRQLYGTTEGLRAIYSYDLHSSVAGAWQQAVREMEESKTPTLPPVTSGYSDPVDGHRGDKDEDDDANTIREMQSLDGWEDTLKDNLLNFAATPKGVLLLQQSGAMEDCVAYMYARYIKKLQVSRMEKFGYGSFVTQVAGTAVGIAALHSKGFIKTLVTQAWLALEHGTDESHFHPRVWTVEPLDRAAQKPLTNLLNVLSSFAAVYELLGDTKLPSKAEYSFRDVPGTVPELIDRLVLIDSDAKVHWLFNYEQSHAFGLRLLSCLVSCLDTLLLLNSQFDVLAVLLANQSSEDVCSNGKIIIDGLTVERNYILVKSYVVGGPSERLLPLRTLSDDAANPYPFAMVTGYPVPKEYALKLSSKAAVKGDEVAKFITETKQADLNQSWLDKCRRTLCSCLMTSKIDISASAALPDLLERSISALLTCREEAIFTAGQNIDGDSNLKLYKLTSLQEQGVQMAVRYGTQLKLLGAGPSSSSAATAAAASSEAADGLSLLLRQCGYFLKLQQRKADAAALRLLSGSYPGFDWFASTLFLIMRGNRERTWKLLQSLSMLTVSAFLWPARLHLSMHLPPSLATCGVPPLFSSMCHKVELLLQLEVPRVYSAFKMSGYTASQICQHWVKQCFWNYLDWTDICSYVCVCIVLGVDYQVYICIAILKHLSKDILQHQQQQDLVIFLKEEPLRGFHVAEHLAFMQQLEKKFRKSILSSMLNMTRP